MKIAFLCSDDISNKLFIQTLKKYNFEIAVVVENNDSNKKNLIPLLKTLKRFNINIISSGGTYSTIKKLGFKCIELSKYTKNIT